MNEQKRRRLEAAGWTVGSVEDFLGLSPAELAYIDMSLALSRLLIPNPGNSSLIRKDQSCHPEGA